MKKHGLIITVLILVFLKGYSQPPDIIFYNANIITLDELLPNAEAIAIEGNLILQIGSNSSILALQGTNTQMFDLEGRTIVPGLIDNHSHRLNNAFWESGPDGLEMATHEMAADGYTTVHELYGDAGLIECAQQLASENRLAVRINFYIPYNTNAGEDIEFWQTYPYTEKKDTLLRVVGAKIFADGGSIGAAAITTLYQSGPAAGTHGDIFKTQEEMNTAVSEVLQAGYPIAMHALGDSGVVVGLNAFENEFGKSENILRSRMEHLRVMQEDLVIQMAEIDLVASIQYSWANTLSASTYEALFLPEVLDWVFPWKRMKESGITIAGGNDYPFCSRSQAMQVISYLATRKSQENDVVPYWMAGDALTVEEGLIGMTTTNAWVVFEENVKGTITPGKLADLTILSENPLTTDPFDVRDISIEMTVMDGIIKHNQLGIDHTAIHEAGVFRMGIDDRGLWGPKRPQVGLIYEGVDHLYQGSVMISYNNNTIATAVSQSDYLTSWEGWVDYNEPGEIATEEVTVIYEDAENRHLGKIQIKQKTYMWENDPVLIAEYTFTNIGDELLSDIYVGQFMDLDVVNWSTNMCGWENSHELGFAYMYNEDSTYSPYIGMAMIDDSGNYINSTLTFMSGYNLNSDNESYISELMRNHIIQTETTEKDDYAMLMAEGPNELDINQSITPFYLVFAVGNNLETLIEAFQLASERSKTISNINYIQNNPTEHDFLCQNYPNPFNETTEIIYTIPNAGFIELKVINIYGEEVAKLVSENKEAGRYSITYDAGNLTSGVYYCSLQFLTSGRVGIYREVKKMIFIK
ncbi:amidohydrolase family protein [Bacteroidota bacterium]